MTSKTIIITGTNRGIGRASVKDFAEKGYDVWACARKPREEFETDMAREAARKGAVITSGEKIELVHAGIAEKGYQMEAWDSSKPVYGDAQFDLLNRPEVERDGIQIYSIDEYFEKKPVPFEKADIAGFENQMLDGAVKVIQRDKPRLAICIYHSCADMYRIALKIRAICLECNLVIRQHSYTFNESVVYAYI